MKKCRVCGVDSSSHQRKLATGEVKTFYYGYCGSCRARKYKYGLTDDEISIINNKDNCDICNRIISGKNKHVDHCHDTDEIRGTLCYQCNAGIGYFYDNPELLLNAIKYLSK